MRSLWLVSSVLLFGLPGTAHSQSASCSDATCETGNLAISETPQGVVDGWNPTFVLSKQPSQDFGLLVFRNGIRMNSNQDFSAKDRTITFVPAQVPVPGDFVRVEYSPSKKRTIYLPGLSSPPIGSRAVRSEDEVTTQAARQALKDESRRFADAFRDRRQRVPVSGNSEVEEPGGARSSALVMLDKRLREPSAQGQELRKHSSQSSGDMTGLEGAGDEPQLSPFRTSQYENRAAEGTRNESPSNSFTDASPTPASAGVRMLERRLIEETEPANQKRKKKSNSHNLSE